MNIDDKKKTLVKWLHAFGIHYVTLFGFKDDICTFDFLDEHKTSFAGLCLGSVNQVVAFPYPYNDALEWHACIAIDDDEHAINFIANFLDAFLNAKAWNFEDGYFFFCEGPIHGRMAIDLTNFSWEALAVGGGWNFPEDA